MLSNYYPFSPLIFFSSSSLFFFSSFPSVFLFLLYVSSLFPLYISYHPILSSLLFISYLSLSLSFPSSSLYITYLPSSSLYLLPSPPPLYITFPSPSPHPCLCLATLHQPYKHPSSAIKIAASVLHQLSPKLHTCCRSVWQWSVTSSPRFHWLVTDMTWRQASQSTLQRISPSPSPLTQTGKLSGIPLLLPVSVSLSPSLPLPCLCPYISFPLHLSLSLYLLPSPLSLPLYLPPPPLRCLSLSLLPSPLYCVHLSTSFPLSSAVSVSLLPSLPHLLSLSPCSLPLFLTMISTCLYLFLVAIPHLLSQ